MPENEIGWYPDLTYRDGHFEAGVAVFADTSGKITRFSSEASDLVQAKRLPARAILPGMINAHSHSFQRTIRARTEHRTFHEQDSFWTWREAMYRAANRLSPDDLFDVAKMAFFEMVRSGITTVGEFHYVHRDTAGRQYENPNLNAIQVIRAAQEVGLRIALLRTAYARAGWQKEADRGQARFITKDPEEFLLHTAALESEVRHLFASDHAWVGIAPHSIRAVPLPYLTKTIHYARSLGLKVHMHVAEQPAEVEACEAEYGLPPIELLESHGLLDSAFTAVHATHCSKKELGYLARAQAHVCACPTTERNLGDGIAPADLWAELGVPICFGTDSNVQIDLLEDARELEYHLRLKKLRRVLLADSARQLFRGATEGGAASLGAPGAGELAENRPADFFTVDLNEPSIAGADRDSLLSEVVFAAQRGAIRDVYVGGKAVMQEGRLPEEAAIIGRFKEVQRRLWA